jgi:DNA-binding CsgD family transcriptional regulator
VHRRHRGDPPFQAVERWRLSQLEREVLDLRLKGYGPAEIADVLKRDRRVVYDAMQRIRRKASA